MRTWPSLRDSAPPANVWTSRRHGSTAAAAGTVDFLLADIGEGISEVEVLRWFVQPGQPVKQFDKICEVQSDKANVEISSRYDGVIKSLCYKEGEMARVGAPLVRIEVGGGAAEAPAQPQAQAPKSPASAPPAAGAAGEALSGEEGARRALATPAVRQYAKERGVELAAVPARDPAGRRTRDDIDAFLAARAAPAPPAGGSGRGLGTGTAAAVRAAAREEGVGAGRGGAGGGGAGAMRAMVRSMTASNAVPHFGFGDEAVVDALAALRDKANATPGAMPEGPDGRPVKLTYTPFFVKALASAAAAHPILNASFDAERMEVRYHGEVNVGVAVDAPGGLVVPVVRGAQRRSVAEIALELQRLLRLAREGRLPPEDLAGATITLSNIGAVGGGIHASPRIVPPQVAIVALGAVRLLPRCTGPAPAPLRPAAVLPISWAADHRVVDGATVARASRAFVAACEEPALLALTLR
eukprot:tig00021493_g21876.t1